MLMLETCLG